ncbi:MAG: hypothetical protein ACLPSW_25370 [Roseiarcus sp.]
MSSPSRVHQATRRVENIVVEGLSRELGAQGFDFFAQIGDLGADIDTGVLSEVERAFEGLVQAGLKITADTFLDFRGGHFRHAPQFLEQNVDGIAEHAAPHSGGHRVRGSQ